MDPIDSTTTLADLVTERPSLAPRLDRLGLDYCCGGRQSLAVAIADAGLDLEATLLELASTPAVQSAQEWDGMAGLVDHIERTHHAYLHDALPRLGALAEKVTGVHGDRHPELARVNQLVVELRSDLEPHLREEEQVLFPMIRELAESDEAPSFHSGTLHNPIEEMLGEHDHVGELLAALRQATNDFRPPADGCASYQRLFDGLSELEADTHLHVHKENNLLFPAAIESEGA